MAKSIKQTLSFSAGASEVISPHFNNADIINSDGNATIGAKITSANITVSCYCSLLLGDLVGYGPWLEVLDESGTRVSTFDSTKVFYTSLYNQSWFSKSHKGFRLKFTVTSGSISGGEEILCDTLLS